MTRQRAGSSKAGALLAGALYLSLTGCGGKPAPATPKPSADEWRKQSLSLSVEGYMFEGALKPAVASWVGSGAWIGPDIAVTNAHVALRGLKITGKDDLGKTYEFNQILAVDEEADLAIIKASPGSSSYLHLLDKPTDPRSLRGTNVRVIGNTGGLGLSFYDGRITNVVGEEPGNTVLLHDANTAGGSSGGPLINQAGELVGINHSSLPSLNAKAAAPAWVVKKLAELAVTHKAAALQDAFNPSDMPVSWYVERAVCMKPGEVFKGVFATVATNDLVAEITPAQTAPIGFVLTDGNEVKAEAMITGKAQGAWTLLAKGQYIFAVVNPKDAPAAACATVKFGRINWAERFK